MNKFKKIALFFLPLLFLIGMTSCTTTQQSASYQGASLGAAVGAVAGALLDDGNPWRGAVIGGTMGAVLGGGLAELSSEASASAATTGQPVVYRQGNTVVEATPLNYNQQTKCHKVRKRIWQNGQLVQDHVEEVCEAQKVTNSYF
ncbi:YMGG-like glycine zipper-containing protein [Thermodesulfatator atlanticus]|uniref:YMGG-like glycine zipper-containing protein n=1 Tax=Thermodesulfatator atlanticus TaxID=501497 RepID=UPI0003B68A0F|nr:YMGG-like glycine zipper-containing protein [Thermodesulfatator atlanticus]